MLVPSQAREAMIVHAENAYPEEACGLLAFDVDGALRMVYCLTNIQTSDVAFTVDPDEHFQAMLHAERHGWSIGGVFHSHPRTPAVPSRSDVEGALDPDWVHVIVSLSGHEPELRAWAIDDGDPTEITLREPLWR
jgi:proteasome lid subunit RPN8/RPN11